MKKKKRKENNGAEKAREVKRHKQLDERQIDRIEEDEHERNTKKSTVWAMNALRDWLEEEKQATDNDRLGDYSCLTLWNSAALCSE